MPTGQKYLFPCLSKVKANIATIMFRHLLKLASTLSIVWFYFLDNIMHRLVDLPHNIAHHLV